jgi:antirestriction protein ArdC
MARRNLAAVKDPNQAQEKLHTALDKLEAGIAAIIDGESFARYLRTLACFHTYSAHNALLIQAQRPDATRVTGYRAWQALGRQVRKGEKGIMILVPLGFRVAATEAEPARNAQNAQNPDEPQGGHQTPGTVARVVTRFGVGYVFDVAQTDGEPLPAPPAARLLEEASDLGAALWDALRAWLEAQGVAVGLEDFERANGYYDPARRKVAPRRDRPRGQDPGA